MLSLNTRINARITSKEDQQLNQLIKTGKYPTKSDAVREAIESFLTKETVRQ